MSRAPRTPAAKRDRWLIGSHTKFRTIKTKLEDIMSKGQFEVSLPVPFLKGDIQADVYEVGGASPVSIIRSDQDWGVKVRWQLEGSLLPFICGKWCIHLRLESLGTGRELTLE